MTYALFNIPSARSISCPARIFQLIYHKLISSPFARTSTSSAKAPAAKHCLSSHAAQLAAALNAESLLPNPLPPEVLNGAIFPYPYFRLPYCFSSTGSSHSFEPFSPGTSIAKCENQLSGAAPCQCFTPVGIFIQSPGFISTASLPHS